MSEVGRANGVGSIGWSSEELSDNWVLDNNWDVLEDVTLGDDVTTGTDLESVSTVVVPVVVDSVEEGVSLNLGGTTRSAVDVVVLEGDQVRRTIEVETPVVVSVASGGVVRATIEVVVGDSNTVRGERAKNNVLTGNVVGGYMINPDQISVVDGDGVTSPDVFRVDLLDLDVSESSRLVQIK